MLTFFFFLYPALELLAAGILLLSVFRQSWRHLRRAATILFVLHTALLVITFVLLSLDPYWDDNGSKEYMDFADRWLWALLMLAFFEPILGPGLFLCFLFMKKDPEITPDPV